MATEQMVTLQSLHDDIVRIKDILAISKNVLTLDEVSIYTGLSKSYLYKLTMSGILPHSKPNGKSIFVDKVELEKWLLSSKRTTPEQKEVAAATYLAAIKINSKRK